jgi:hypothetical protein
LLRVERLALVDSSVIPPAYLLMEVIKVGATDNGAKEPINQRVWPLLVSFRSQNKFLELFTALFFGKSVNL